MAEEEEAVAMGLGFGDVEVCSDEGDEDRVEEIVDEFVEQLGAFLQVGLRELGRWRDLGRL